MFDLNYQAASIRNRQVELNAVFDNLHGQFMPGYKPRSVIFTDIPFSEPGIKPAKVTTYGIVFSQGAISYTGIPTHLAVNGAGFFILGDGAKKHYTRDGRFYWKDCTLIHQTGMKLMGYPLDGNGNITGSLGDIRMEMDPGSKLYRGRYTNYKFDASGKLYGETNSIDPLTGQVVSVSTPLYQVALSGFTNPNGLKMRGDTVYEESGFSGCPVTGTAGGGALGVIVPASLEVSTVDFAREAAAVGMARQGYDADFASFKVMDAMIKKAINLNP
ncbi:MAG: hypothetical protein M1269_06840 [Chloroflexi bacterium]|nr:hypothetical protein [Chloroflexota bacterium]